MGSYNAACLLGIDHEVGSLEPGKLADFCILNEDLLEMDPERILDMTVAATVVGGEAKYTDPSFKGL